MGDTLLEEDALLEAKCLFEAEANCLLGVKPLIEAKSIGFRVSSLLFGAQGARAVLELV